MYLAAIILLMLVLPLISVAAEDADAARARADVVRSIHSASELRLKPGLDGLEQPEAHRAVVALERDHEAHPPVLGGVGIARQGADAGKGAGLEEGAVAAAEQGGMGLEEVEHLGEAARREAVAAADARALLKMDGLGEAVGGKHVVRDLERFLEADGSAQGPPDLQEDLVGDVVVRADEQLGKDLREIAGLAMNIDRLQALGHRSGR